VRNPPSARGEEYEFRKEGGSKREDEEGIKLKCHFFLMLCNWVRTWEKSDGIAKVPFGYRGDSNFKGTIEQHCEFIFNR
jgi:hypothetical protein